LELDLPAAAAACAEHRQSRRSDPDRPPNTYCPDPTARSVRGPQATKVRQLAALGYSSREISHFLALDPAVVAEFLSRDGPLPFGPRIKPRTRTEQQRTKAVAARRKRRERARIQLQAKRLATASWGTLSDPDELAEPVEARDPTEAAALSPGAHQVVAELPAAPAPKAPNPWNGPTGFGAAFGSRHSQAKLTEADVIEIRELRAMGWSTHDLAAAFKVKRATICYALNGHTWSHVTAPPPLPCPAAGKLMNHAHTLQK